MGRIALLTVLLTLPAGAVSAETVYVTDILRLGLHAAQDTGDRPFETLVSGAPLEVLDRVPNYARVETEDGQVGWVKSAFLVSEKPAQLRLAELEAQLAALERDLAAASSARQVAERELAALELEHAGRTSAAAAMQDRLAALEGENTAYERRLEAYRRSVPLSWAVAAFAVSLVGGVVAGVWWLDARIRRRHGGFRIY